MNRNSILEMIAKDKTYKLIARNFSKGIEWQELYSIFLAACCELSEEKLLRAYNENYLNKLCCKILVNQYYGKSSKFNYLFRNYKRKNDYSIDLNEYDLPEDLSDTIEKNELEEALNKIENVLTDCHWYDRQIFEIYFYGNHSYNTLAKETKINKRSIGDTVNKVQRILKDKLKKDNGAN